MNQKRVLGIFVLSVLMVNMFAGIVSAEEHFGSIFDPVIDMFTGWEEGNFSVNIAKYLFLFLIAIVIFNILEFVPLIGGEKQPIRWLVAFIVSFLATAYLTPSDVYTMLAGYGALGMTVGGIIPFLILMYFSVQISKDESPGGRIFAKLMWFAFIIFLIWKLVDGMYISDVITYAEGWIYVGLILCSLVWIFFGEKWFLKRFYKAELAGVIRAGSQDLAASLTADINRRNERSQELRGVVKTNYDKKTEQLQKRLDEVS